MALSSGDTVGPYEILEPIGEGGMGAVWKARDTRLHRIVAIKQIKAAHGARFEQEARAIAALNHPHICQIHDIGPDYLVLEYIEGTPLRGPQPLADALRLASQIASALEAAHAKGILHRDLKPGNILVTGNGAKLLDFGLAKTFGDGDATMTIGVSGTPLYMSPEQAEGKPLDARSDIFSFGSVLYELLCGKRAFSSLAAVLRDDPTPLDSPSRDVVVKCLSKQPGARYQSMTEVRAALEQVAAKPAESLPSIAVLPFANMSGDKEQEYFSDGLAEEILNLLAKLPGLKVIARTSSFAFRGKEQDIRGIAEALNVTTILEGSVRRAGNRIRVTAQLIDARDGAHLWSERYDRELTDVFAVQDEVAAAISEALQLKLAPKPAAERYKPNLPAYEAYLKGRHLNNKLTPDSLARAKESLEQAISLDPKFALPYSLLGRLCVSLVVYGAPASTWMPQVETLAKKALELDPSSADAASCLAMKACMYDYDWAAAERWFARALAQQPIPAMACCDYVLYKGALGRGADAEPYIRAAVEADPLMVFNRLHLALLLEMMGRAKEAEHEYRHILDLDESYSMALSGLGRILLAAGEISEATQLYEKLHAIAPRGFVTGVRAGLLARSGNRERAERLLAEVGSPETASYVVARSFFHMILGETEAVGEWWDKLIDHRNPIAVFCHHVPGFALRSSPRWPALAKRMNLPESAW